MLNSLSRLSFSSAGLRGRVPQASAKGARIRSSPAASPFSRRLPTSPDQVPGGRAAASDTDAPDTPKPYSAIPGRGSGRLSWAVFGICCSCLGTGGNRSTPCSWSEDGNMVRSTARRLPRLGNAIMLHDANDVQTMCGAEGSKYPARIPIPMWVQARSELQGPGLRFGNVSLVSLTVIIILYYYYKCHPKISSCFL